MAISPRNTSLAIRVEEAYKEDSDIFGYGIWTHHILSAILYGEQLADLVGADTDYEQEKENS